MELGEIQPPPAQARVITDWDDAYANMPHVPGSEALPGIWAAKAAAFRDGHRPEVLRYGDHPRQTIDLFRPSGAAHGLLVFVHGGYWMKFAPSDFSHLAVGALTRGWAVAMPGYVLAPEARIARIGRDVARAVEVAAAAVPGPLVLSGHSAGGHLAARLICGLTDPARVARVVAISGLHDLRPLLRTAMNEAFRLDSQEARAESPALLTPAPVPTLSWVGADERPEFVRQSLLPGAIWPGLGVPVATHVEPRRHHFDVIDAMEDAASPLMDAMLGGIGSGGGT
ncbi:MAG: alpha/beta hydrolase [Paracoccaceae bacterium]